MDFERETVGGRIRVTRKRLGITQQELGERLGVSGAMIGQYESGVRNPKFDTVKRLADALCVDANWLLHGYTLTERNDGLLEQVDTRRAEATIQTKMTKLNSEGLKKAVDYIDLLIISGRYNRQPTPPAGTRLTVHGEGPAGSFPPKPEEDD